MLTNNLMTLLTIVSLASCASEARESSVEQDGFAACSEACMSTTDCGTWCSICGTGTLGSTNGRCVHGLPVRVPMETSTTTLMVPAYQTDDGSVVYPVGLTTMQLSTAQHPLSCGECFSAADCAAFGCGVVQCLGIGSNRLGRCGLPPAH